MRFALLRNKNLLLSLSFIAFLFFPFLVLASAKDGTIDGTSKYAWGEKAGWINFGTTGGNVHVNDDGLTGQAWSENYGWINLNSAISDVKNNGAGNLSGSAWSSNLGYISFDNVSISSEGVFSGTADGANSQRISFDCTNCRVVTDWRYQSSRAPDRSRGESGGGGLAQAEELRLLINSGAISTNNPLVTLEFSAGSDAANVLISSNPDFIGAALTPYSKFKQWNLCALVPGVILEEDKCLEGTHTVYAKFLNAAGRLSSQISSSILYVKPAPKAGIIPRAASGIKDVFQSLLPEFLKPKEIKKPELALPEIPREAPPALKGGWNLFPEESVYKLVFEPLSEEIALFVNKFPTLKRAFEKTGILKESDLAKLRSVKFTLPDITEVLGLPEKILSPGNFILPLGVPIAQLSPPIRANLPTDVVFTRSIDEKIDFNTVLRLTESGKLEAQFNVVSGMPIHLVIKPDKPVTRVIGHLIFVRRGVGPIDESGFLESVKNALGFGIFKTLVTLASPPEKNRFLNLDKVQLASISDIIYQKLIESTAVNAETRLSLLEFEYIDSDSDGIYTADVEAPKVDGKYEIITRLDYKDKKLGSKEIKTVAVVDPEGYIYERDGKKEIRVPDAAVTLYYWNDEKKQYEIWPANLYSQENPQITDVRGTYGFLTPEGSYYLEVKAPGYEPYKGKLFEVKRGASGIHINIELKSRYPWLNIFDWKTAVLAAVALLLIFYFWKSKSVKF